ncbi:NADH-quinone oxidoreductase subunit L, partial [Halobacteriales archaeon SW_10_66_29]
TGLALPVARVANKFDQFGIDGLVDAAGTASVVAGERFRRIQTGVVTNYAALLALGLVLLLLVFGLAGGWF